MSLFEQRLQRPFARRQRRQPVRLRRQRPLPVWLLVTAVTAVYLAWIIFRSVFFFFLYGGLPPIAIEALQLSELGFGLMLVPVWGILGWQYVQQTAVSPISQTILDREDLYAMSPAEFEQFVGRLFRAKGYRVKLRGKSGDMGVDVEVRNANGKKAIVQCKRYRNTVGPKTVRELYGTLIHERAAHAFLITTADVSASAIEWAEGKPMTLIDGETLVHITLTLDRYP